MALLETLTDNFNDNSIDGAKWVPQTSGGTVTETNSRLEAVASGLTIANFSSVNTFDLTNSFARAKIVQATATHVNAGAGFGITTDTGEQFTIRLANTSVLQFMQNNTVVSTVTYNASTHAYWRLRNAGGLIYYETSSNDITWTTHLTITPATSIVNVYVGLSVFGQPSQSATLYMDDFNVYNANLLVDSMFPPVMTSAISLTQAGTVTPPVASGVTYGGWGGSIPAGTGYASGPNLLNITLSVDSMTVGTLESLVSLIPDTLLAGANLTVATSAENVIVFAGLVALADPMSVGTSMSSPQLVADIALTVQNMSVDTSVSSVILIYPLMVDDMTVGTIVSTAIEQLSIYVPGFNTTGIFDANIADYLIDEVDEDIIYDEDGIPLVDELYIIEPAKIYKPNNITYGRF